MPLGQRDPLPAAPLPAHPPPGGSSWGASASPLSPASTRTSVSLRSLASSARLPAAATDIRVTGHRRGGLDAPAQGPRTRCVAMCRQSRVPGGRWLWASCFPRWGVGGQNHTRICPLVQRPLAPPPVLPGWLRGCCPAPLLGRHMRAHVLGPAAPRSSRSVPTCTHVPSQPRLGLLKGGSRGGAEESEGAVSGHGCDLGSSKGQQGSVAAETRVGAATHVMQEEACSPVAPTPSARCLSRGLTWSLEPAPSVTHS